MASRDEGPPQALIDALVDGPSLVSAVEWHPTIDSTNRRAADAAAAGAAEGLLVIADEQMAGRGRHGRRWTAPPGTSLMLSLLLRDAAGTRPGLVPLAAGVALAEASAAHVEPARVALKWPNDLLAAAPHGEWGKAAGILVEAGDATVVLGLGVNVDWREVARPAELAGATSLSEVAGRPVDRWRLLAALAGVITNRLQQARTAPARLLDTYRSRCTTLGRAVRVALPDGQQLSGWATELTDDGALLVESEGDRHVVHAGDVVHLQGR